MADCVFCKIAAGDTPADFIWEDDEVVVFKDIAPKAPVHLLVAPRQHIESVKDLRDEQGNIVSKLVFVARDIAAKQGLAGYKLIFNVGREGGAVVDHLHLHLLGGWESGLERGKFPV